MDHTLRYLLLVLTAFALGRSSSAQNLIALQNESGVTYYPNDSLQQALNEAQNGDVLQLPGGTFSRSGGFSLNKSLTILGTGHSPDSTLATGSSVISSLFYLNAGASNSYISGIRFTTYVYCPPGVNPTIKDLFFHRCYFGQRWGGTTIGSYNQFIGENSSNITFLECVLQTVYLNNATNCRVLNCVLNGNLFDGRSLVVESCVGLATGAITISGSSCVIRGNIFIGNAPNVNSAVNSTSVLSSNCIVGPLTTQTDLLAYDNIGNAQLDQIFVAFTAPYDPTNDLHLASGSPAIGAGPGGTDCGIYGGTSPRKDGALPTNPHVMQKAIGATTNAQCELPVTIRVAAQGN